MEPPSPVSLMSWYIRMGRATGSGVRARPWAGQGTGAMSPPAGSALSGPRARYRSTGSVPAGGRGSGGAGSAQGSSSAHTAAKTR